MSDDRYADHDSALERDMSAEIERSLPREDVETQRILLYEDEIDRLKSRLEQTERVEESLKQMLAAATIKRDEYQARVGIAERERDEAMEGQREQLQERLHYERRAEALERALHVAEETLGLETDEDSWISLKRRVEALERALRQIADADPYDADSYALTWVARTALGEKK